ncbi:deferrochelatase/peroxidase EfeB [Catenuloplanes nepalensis]|uniref:Deferrochelatase/peroxidase EfeB n=1 Tax=Catenuloplanes nepalensis TaxID=587533 RepID=A0ABT9MSP6_9ACTN|nr:Dyp-type peroxidase [Catenuloplanes nepalensis]MDP9794283.1 deferrochelatase/peroxidase EfeB [Catenuloplanes nepalensis]
MTGDLSRRALLTAIGAAGLASACSAPPAAAPPARKQAAQPRLEAVLAPVGPATVLLALDVTAPGRPGLESVLRELGDRLPRATATVAVGAALFDGRFGLSAPRRLAPMPAFRADVLDPAWCHGDLLVQVSGESADAVAAPLSPPVPGTHERWRIAGHHPPSPDGAVRNLFGFREGSGNPDTGDAALMDRVVWIGPDDGEPGWCVGGTYQVVRLIALAMPTWDRETDQEHERVFGRSKSTGAPLGRVHETDRPDHAADPDGRVIGLDAHIRRANPGEPPRMLRRGYSYHRESDAGQIFISYQRDPEHGFATVQRRLAGEALERYTLPFGGGYFLALPHDDAFPGRAMLGA